MISRNKQKFWKVRRKQNILAYTSHAVWLGNQQFVAQISHEIMM